MVYFKVNRVLAQIIKLAEMREKSAIGCTKDCDKQLISLDHLDICLSIIHKKADELEKILEDQKLVKEAKAAKPDKDLGKGVMQTKEQLEESMRKMRLQAKLMMIDQMPEGKIKAAEKTLAELKQFHDKKAPEIGRQSEMLMTQDHMCNHAIKAGLKSTNNGIKLKNPKTGMVHLIKSSDDVIEFNEASMTTLIERNKINPETAEQRA